MNTLSSIVRLAAQFAMSLKTTSADSEYESEQDRDLEILNSDYYKSMQTQFPDRTAEIEELIRQNGGNFSGEGFIEFAKNVFNDTEAALSENNMEAVRHFFTGELYGVMSKKCRVDFVNNTLHLKYLEADKAHITSYLRNSDYETVGVFLTVKRVEWQRLGRREKMAGKETEAKVDSRYRLKFTRKSGEDAWRLFSYELIKYHTVDEAIVIS